MVTVQRWRAWCARHRAALSWSAFAVITVIVHDWRVTAWSLGGTAVGVVIVHLLVRVNESFERAKVHRD